MAGKVITPYLDDYVRRMAIDAARKLQKEDIRYSGDKRFEVISPSVEVHIDGSLVKIVAQHIKVKHLESPARSYERGEVTSFSSSSRRRLMRLIARTNRSDKPLFITLTYPDEFEDSFDRWKRDIDVFGKRFARAFAGASFIWRIEFKERKSGKKKGHIAPHLHLLAWGVGLSEMREFSSSAWYGVVGSKNEDHLRAGVSCQYIRKWRGTISYVSKYIAKTDNLPEGWRGRVWGIVLRKNMPFSAVVVISVTNEVAVRSIRLARKMMGLKGKVLRYGVSFLIKGDRFLDYLEWAIEQQ